MSYELRYGINHLSRYAETTLECHIFPLAVNVVQRNNLNKRTLPFLWELPYETD